jgi:hypothetical protein
MSSTRNAIANARPIELSDEEEDAIDERLANQNKFYTGSLGQRPKLNAVDYFKAGMRDSRLRTPGSSLDD